MERERERGPLLSKVGSRVGVRKNVVVRANL